ncbi:MAG: hypothetical protein R3231_07150 [bacterium]|nr:hypothetical protein [bacterium]
MKDEKQYWLERPGSIRKLWILLWAICALTVLPDFFLHRHPHFGIDHISGFFALLGFVACAILILAAKVISFVLKKKVNYYD